MRVTQVVEGADRVADLVESVTYRSAMYVLRGLFERHKLTFIAELCLQIFISDFFALPPDQQNPAQFSLGMLNYLTRFPRIGEVNPPVEWLTVPQWGAVLSLAALEPFNQLPNHIESASKRWKKWCDSEAPEKEPMPQVIVFIPRCCFDFGILILLVPVGIQAR